VKRILTIEPEAEAEITDAAAWYDERGKQLQARFLAAVSAALDDVQQRPEQYQIVHGRARRIMVPGFPYALFYLASEREVSVVACFHSSRDPKQWQARLR
jgi:plasmid stabilization system protein ParE